MADISMSYTTADGSIFSAQGWIHIEERTTDDFKMTLEMHPRTDWQTLGNSASPNDSGTISKVTINGVSYDATADGNFSEAVSIFKNESIATSGRNMRKMTRQPPIVKSVTIACNYVERTALKALSESL